MKNINKRGQLISTLMRTLYEASATEEEDQRPRHGRGDSVEDGVVDVPSCPFRRRARGRPACYNASFLRSESKRDRARATVGGEQDRLAGTSEHIDQVSDLLRRESECCYWNRSSLLQRESEWCQKEKT
jgi:hypothetical protein